MTDSNRSMNEVPGLIEERRRYEGWLSALEARRESTPKHVFERVQADYRARLQRVAEQLASHRQAIEEEQTSVKSRLSLLEAEERLRRDERAELELRRHVGELVGDDAEVAFGTVDAAISQLVDEKTGLEARVAELQTLLDEGAPTPPTQGLAAPADSATAEPENAAEEGPVVDDAAPAPAVYSAEAPAAVPAPPAAPAAEPTRPARSSFDELAFLSSVVGKEAPNGPVVERKNSEVLLRPNEIDRRDSSAESLLAGIDGAKKGENPLAANVSANNPIVLRPTGTMEQAKTLKCNECGAVNYPTEWYCERCGAELAAM